ncbi:MAG: TrkH family potassium uptake protein [Halobacteriaceae archaeon]
MSRQLRVDWRAALSLTGRVTKWLSVPLLFPIAIASYYGRGLGPFALTLLVALVLGWALERLHDDPREAVGAREGFLMVAATWLIVSVVGALPYVLEGAMTTYGAASTLRLPVNALFESMSGFTTTGSTVMGSIGFERHSRAVMMWRQETQWLGGMGIIVLAIAILPELSAGGAQLMDAEAPGPGLEKLTPRIAETARALWGIYIGLTVLEILGLVTLHALGMAPEMGVYNAVAHGFTTMPTGGFSPAAHSIAAFSAAVQWLIVPFMVFAGINFALFWHLLTGDWSTVATDVEVRAYFGIVATVALLLFGLLYTAPSVTPLAGSLEPALRHAVFQAVTIVTTTGYASIDFAAWGQPAQYVLVAAMFIGGSAGSTGGSIKIVRWVVIVKSLGRELFSLVHPDAVRPVRLGERSVDETAIRGIYAFTLLYLLLFVVATTVIVANGVTDGTLSAFEAMSAVAATLGNVGPGVGIVGPMNHFIPFPRSSKLFMVFLMWVGRLEIFPVAILLTRAYWRS